MMGLIRLDFICHYATRIIFGTSNVVIHVHTSTRNNKQLTCTTMKKGNWHPRLYLGALICAGQLLVIALCQPQAVETLKDVTCLPLRHTGSNTFHLLSLYLRAIVNEHYVNKKKDMCNNSHGFAKLVVEQKENPIILNYDSYLQIFCRSWAHYIKDLTILTISPL